MAARQCIQCVQSISGRQQAVQCSGCERWQHRTCGTGISQDAYREAVRLDTPLVWTCASCATASVTSLLQDLDIATPAVPAAPAAQGRKKRVAKFRSLKPSTKTAATASTTPAVTAADADPTATATKKRVAKLRRSAIPCKPPSCDQFSDDIDDLDLPPVSMPTTVTEDDMPEPLPIVQPISLDPDFQILDECTQRGKSKLVDSQGYSYNQCRIGKTVTYWRCAVRNQTTRCAATVQQKGNDFTRGPQPHNHHGEPGAAANCRIQREVKREAAANIFEPALTIVESVMRKETAQHGIRPGLPKPQNLTRMANYTREKLRPDEPQDLDFVYNAEYIPGFMVGDLRVNGNRHLMFASDHQLRFLKTARTWYLDGTFKVVRQPFTQLWSIHAFVAKGDDLKQLPFLYVLMSSRRTVDYKAVFEQLKVILTSEFQVKEMVLDFELSLWKAIAECFPDVKMRGCVFHWTQCVWRKIQGVGLQGHYMQDVGVHRVCKQLLGLPFLPAQHIRTVFEKLQERATSDDLQQLTDYIEINWMESAVWTPEAWSCFGQSIRTNNDVEGWHHRINAKAKKGNLPFYMLLGLLWEETEMLDINLHLISEHRLKRYQRTQYRELQATIFEAWDNYTKGRLTVTQLLDTCAGIYQPTE